MYKKLNDDSFSYTLVNVQIDEEAGLVKRTFSHLLPNVSGLINPRNKTAEEVTKMFNTEIYWLDRLNGSKFVPELISYDYERQEVVQKYYEPSCLLTRKKPSIDQILELYTFFKSHDMFKINGSLSNMSYNGNQLIAFDFKHAIHSNPEKIEYEYFSFDSYLSKIDKSLPVLLREILNG